MQANLWDAVYQKARSTFSNVLWVVCSRNSEAEYSYKQVFIAAAHIIKELKKQQIGKGSVVAILAPNGPQWGAMALACMKLGAVIAPLHAANSKAELKEQYEVINPDILFYYKDDCGLKKAQQIALDFTETEAALAELDKPSICDVDDELLRIYTSGSTGAAKIVRLSHKNVLANIAAMPSLKVDLSEKDRFISLLPLSHCMEFTVGFILPLVTGASILIPRAIAANEIMQALLHQRVSVILGVPRLFRNIMLNMQKRFKEGGKFMTCYLTFLKVLPPFIRKRANILIRNKVSPHVQMWLSGGSKLDADIARFYQDIGFNLRQGYGLTECAPLVSAQSNWDKDLESVGKTIDCVQIKIVNSDEQGQGELLVKGDNVMLGYMNPEHNEHAFQDGWYKTGDIAKQRKNGKLVLTGRSKRLIVTEAGKNVYPEDIELNLEKQALVKEAGVVEVDARPAAVLALEPKNFKKAADILRIYNATVSGHNKIVRYAVVTELPRTPLGKISLKDLPDIFVKHEVLN